MQINPKQHILWNRGSTKWVLNVRLLYVEFEFQIIVSEKNELFNGELTIIVS